MNSTSNSTRAIDAALRDPGRKRRHLRFSLRTLFLVVTVFAGWLGFQLNWIHKRREFVAQRLVPVGHADYPRMINTGKMTTRTPGILWLLGEGGHARLDMRVFQGGLAHPPSHQKELEMAQRLFPEARVSCTVVADE